MSRRIVAVLAAAAVMSIAGADGARAQDGGAADGLAEGLDGWVTDAAVQFGPSVDVTFDAPVSVFGEGTGAIVRFPEAVAAVGGRARVTVDAWQATVVSFADDVVTLAFVPDRLAIAWAVETGDDDAQPFVMSGTIGGQLSVDVAAKVAVAGDYGLDDITINGPGIDGFSAERSHGVFEAEATESGRLTYTVDTLVEGLVEPSAVPGRSNRTDRIEQTAVVTGFDRDGGLRLFAGMLELASIALDVRLMGDPGRAHLVAAIQTVFAAMDGLFATLDSTMTRTGASFAVTPDLTLRITEASDHLRITGFDAEFAQGHQVSRGRIDADGPPVITDLALLPISYDVNVTADSMPRAVFFSTLEAILREGIGDRAAADDRTPREVFLDALGDLLVAGERAGTTYVVETAKLAGPDYDIAGTGFAAMQDAAAYHAVGEASVSFGGIDALLRRMAAVPMLEEVAVALNVLRVFAHPGDEAGRHTMTFEVTADGQILVNGADIGPMFSGRP